MAEPVIIFEHPEFLAIDKPSGLLVHGVGGKKREEGKEPTLVDWVLARYPEVSSVGDDPADRPGIVHRLDKETSGIILVARTQASFLYLKSLFQEHKIQKTYRAWVLGKMKNTHGVIDVPIGIKSGTIKRSVHSLKMQKEAITEYRVLKEKKGEDDTFYSFLEVMPRTGRTHQIRVHLASLGHPLLGDPLYGKRVRSVAPRLMLHAYSLEFNAQNGNRFHIESELPDDFKNFAPRHM